MRAGLGGAALAAGLGTGLGGILAAVIRNYDY